MKTCNTRFTSDIDVASILPLVGNPTHNLRGCYSCYITKYHVLTENNPCSPQALINWLAGIKCFRPLPDSNIMHIHFSYNLHAFCENTHLCLAISDTNRLTSIALTMSGFPPMLFRNSIAIELDSGTVFKQLRLWNCCFKFKVSNFKPSIYQDAYGLCARVKRD